MTNNIAESRPMTWNELLAELLKAKGEIKRLEDTLADAKDVVEKQKQNRQSVCLSDLSKEGYNNGQSLNTGI